MATPQASISNAEQQAAPQQVDRVDVRLPAFHPADPEFWFRLIELQFDSHKITRDMTKFSHVCGVLDDRYLYQVRDIIADPPAQEPYNALKNAIIERFTQSQETKTERLLDMEDIGDRKPSEFLRHLRYLAGQTVTDEFLRVLWTKRLPANVQAFLTLQQNNTLEQAAELADKLMKIGISSQVAAVQRPQPSPAPESTQVSQTLNDNLIQFIHSSQAEMASLRQELAALRFGQQYLQPRENQYVAQPSRFQPRPRPRSRSRPRPQLPSTNPVPPEGTTPICWYHATFGARARQCQQPCSFSGNEVARR